MNTKAEKSEKRVAQPDPLRKSIEDRDLNEDEQHQITNVDDEEGLNKKKAERDRRNDTGRK